MPKKQREFLEDEKAEKVDSPPSEAPASQTYSAAGSMLQKNPKTKEAVDSLEIEETVKTEETLQSKDLNSTEKTSEYSKYAEKSSISETKSSRSSEDPSDNRETRSDKSFKKSCDLDSNLCIIKGSSGSIEKRDDQDSKEKDRQESFEENQNSTEKEGSNSGQQGQEKDRMPKKQSEFLEDEKAEEFDSPPSEAPKTKGSSGSIEKRDDQDSTEKDRQEYFEENENSTKKEGSKLGQLEKIASKGKSEGQFNSLKELKKLRETVNQLMAANSSAEAMDKIYDMEKSFPSKYRAMFFGWKASILFETAKKKLMDDWSYKPEARDPVLCMDILQTSVMHAEEAARLIPNCLEFSVGLAQLLKFLKEYQRVKDVCDRALSLNPTELVNNNGGSVKMEAAKMQTEALEKIKKSAEEELSKANSILSTANATDSDNSESGRNVGSAEASTIDGMPARSRRNVNRRRGV